MSLYERYKDDIPTDNTKSNFCEQCETCIWQNGNTNFSNHWKKSSCYMFEYPEMKPPGVINNNEKCEFYESVKK